jgi:type II secretory pathway pseudopilin PulG
MRTLIRRRQSESLQSGSGVSTAPSEAGDTLLEILVALVIISISVVALLGVLTTSITSSTEYRSLTTTDTVLKSFADALKYDVELSSTPIYNNCATSYQVVSEYPSVANVGSGVTVFGTGFSGATTSNVSVILSQPSPTSFVPLTITTFDNGGPTITSGNVSATFTLQSGQPDGYIPPGVYNIALQAGTGLAMSATSLTISPSPSQLNPASGPAGTSVAVSASGFPQNTPLSVQVDGSATAITSGNTMSDANGNAVVTINVPSSVPLGAQSVVLSGGGYSSTSSFTVTTAPAGGPGSVVTPPASAVAGATVQIASIAFWNNNTSVFDSSCGPSDDSGIQLITLDASGSSGVNDTLQVVVTNPSGGAPPGPTLAVANTTPSPVPGQSVTFSATLTGSASTCSGSVCYPTGTVNWNFTSTGGTISPSPCPTTIPAGSGYTSVATCTIPASQVTAGTYVAEVSYSGDDNYGPAEGQGSLTIAQQAPTMTVTPSSTTPVAGEPLTYTATLSGPSGVTPPTGTVTWKFSGGLFGTNCTETNSNSTPVNGASPPSATCTISGAQIFAGNIYSMSTTYSGDINYTPASANSVQVSPNAVVLTNAALVNQLGNTPGKIQSGDSIVVTFTGQVNLGTLCSAWAGDTGTESVSDGVVTVSNTNPDSLTFASSTCAPNENFGSLNLASNAAVKGGNATFTGSTITWNAPSSLIVVLGTLHLNGATLGTVTGNPNSPVYTAGFPVPGSPYTLNTNGNF